MAATSGAENSALAAYEAVPLKYRMVFEQLRDDPWGFQFFQAIRLLERIQPDRAPVGRFVNPSKEIARFGAHAYMAFPASQIQEIVWRENRAPVLIVNFMGLTGPMGVLPLYYTSQVMERIRSKDHSLASFLDIFNHRMISMFYQAWEKYRFTIAYERGERDRFSHHLLDLIGLGTPGLQERQAVPDDSLLFYSGLLSLHPRSATALRQILIDYFDIPVEIDQFVGSWQSLDESDQCLFEDAFGFSNQLGIGAVVGDEIWDQQSAIRIRLGPLTLSQYVDFLPQGSAYAPIRALTKFFAGPEMDFQIQLVLKRDEVPPCELGSTSDKVQPQLGWSTWAKTAPMKHDPDDTVLRIS